MLGSRIRAVILGLLAVALAGSIMTATASAGAGPFWHHRENSKEGVGFKIEETSPETFTGPGGSQKFTSALSGTEFEIESATSEAKGEIFNNTNHGQIILNNFYKEPKLIKPKIAGCEVKVGKENKVPIKGHLAWKWDGTSTQLRAENQEAAGQVPDIIFSVIQLPQQKPAVEEINLTNDGAFTTITFSSACGVLAGTFPVNGSAVGILNHNVEEWSRTLNVRTIANPQSGEKNQIILQHYWDGEAFQGAKIGLLFGKEPAALVGQTETTTAKQEVAIFE
jgi:hypothetical protein